ncbi:lipid A deacylase LpxR family protein [Mangrovitalea sediminis]|uniref:lipid A deacylase LpxR family protein n=1 Tax=Mangrovitalea sediminis TaxID=1982043 RepID=UPI001304038D|nr:lipid A deacylase LpxR family protein [Mangrovitalea sediminis]
MGLGRVSAVLLVILLLVSAPLRADTVGVTWEDDIFVHRDYHYTNGVSLFWARNGLQHFSDTPATWPMRWMGRLFQFSSSRYDFRAVTHAIWQTMQTPENLALTPPKADDLSYAGLLFWQGDLYAGNARVTDRLSLLVGVVGPSSGASSVQHWVHHLINGNTPEGWRFQLHNEPVINLQLGREWRAWQTAHVDLVPGAQLSAGLLKTELSGSVMLRMGRQLAASFPGVDLVASRSAFIHQHIAPAFWYFYVGLGGYYTVNDLLVEGNNFEDSSGLPLKKTGVTRSLGLVWGKGALTLAAGLVDRTHRSGVLTHGVRFGSISVAWRY